MIERAPFGRTGFKSTRTLFGAAALSRVTQKEADRTLETLLEYGVNHIDTAASYGEAELRIGPWMREHRHQFFLATKTGERRYQEAKEQIHRSLERLQVEQLDRPGGERPLAVQPGAAVLGVRRVQFHRLKVAPMLVGDDLLGNNTTPFDRLLEKRLCALQVTLFTQQYV